MRVLLLGPERRRIIACLQAANDEVCCIEEPLSCHDAVLGEIDFVVSYGYRHIVAPTILERFERRAFNLHISVLPWNRGADPNLWSFLEDTPKGVTVHLLSGKLDAGDIVAQRLVAPEPGDTLRSTYQRLSSAVEELFCELWPELRLGRFDARPQQGTGSYHALADRAKFEALLSLGWDTPVKQLIGKARGVGINDIHTP